MTSWRVIALMAVGFVLVVCRPVDERNSRAAPAADAGGPPDSAAPTAAPIKPAQPPLAGRECAQMKQRVERSLAAAQKCKSDGECETAAFDYAFRPCGMAVKTGADLTVAAANAKLFHERCNPVVRPVRCAYQPRAVCQKGRCALAPPDGK